MSNLNDLAGILHEPVAGDMEVDEMERKLEAARNQGAFARSRRESWALVFERVVKGRLAGRLKRAGMPPASVNYDVDVRRSHDHGPTLRLSVSRSDHVFALSRIYAIPATKADEAVTEALGEFVNEAAIEWHSASGRLPMRERSAEDDVTAWGKVGAELRDRVFDVLSDQEDPDPLPTFAGAMWSADDVMTVTRAAGDVAVEVRLVAAGEDGVKALVTTMRNGLVAWSEPTAGPVRQLAELVVKQLQTAGAKPAGGDDE